MLGFLYWMLPKRNELVQRACERRVEVQVKPGRKRLVRPGAKAFSSGKLEAQQLAVILVGITN